MFPAIQAFFPNVFLAFLISDWSTIQKEKPYEHKKEIRKFKRKNEFMKTMIHSLRKEIDNYITRHMGLRYIFTHSSMFPLYCHEDQLALHLFSLSHYVADVHMPLHCDKRPFTGDKSDIHGDIEKEWEKWLIEKGKKKEAEELLAKLEESMEKLR